MVWYFILWYFSEFWFGNENILRQEECIQVLFFVFEKPKKYRCMHVVLMNSFLTWRSWFPLKKRRTSLTLRFSLLFFHFISSFFFEHLFDVLHFFILRIVVLFALPLFFIVFHSFFFNFIVCTGAILLLYKFKESYKVWNSLDCLVNLCTSRRSSRVTFTLLYCAVD